MEIALWTEESIQEMDDDAAVMDGEGGEWSRARDGGVVVDREWSWWFGKRKKRDHVRASDEMGSGNEMALVIFKLIEGHYGNF